MFVKFKTQQTMQQIICDLRMAWESTQKTVYKCIQYFSQLSWLHAVFLSVWDSAGSWIDCLAIDGPVGMHAVLSNGT